MTSGAGAAARAARARLLAAERPSCAEILTFYASLVGVQQSLIDAAPMAHRERPAARLADAIDPHAIAALVPQFLRWLGASANAQLARASARLERIGREEWQAVFGDYVRREPSTSALDEAQLFVVESVLQPFAERVALGWTADDAAQPNPSAPSVPSTPSTSSGDRCPLCAHLPVVASLREQGHGSRRSLVCGLCLLEFRAHRIACLSCGQGDFNALPIYRADDLPGVRVDACDACRTYIKTVDLTQSARAVPVVDDLASLPLDLWAREQGYRKLRPNLLRL